MKHLLTIFSPVMICAMLLSPIALAETSPAQKPKSGPKPVTVTGKLEAGLMAIGGETTGTRVTTNGRVYELEFKKHPELREKVEEYNGKEVTVTGPMRLIRGGEGPDRWVIDVQKLELKGARKSRQPVTVGIEKKMNYAARPTREETTIHLQLTEDEDALDLLIHSPPGIDTVTVTRNANQWPRQINLHLALNGLEHLEVTAGNETLCWGVSSSQPSEIRCWTKLNGAEVPLSPESPQFSPVRRENSLFESEGNRSGGHFAVTLPESLLHSNPDTFVVRFIDFYR